MNDEQLAGLIAAGMVRDPMSSAAVEAMQSLSVAISHESELAGFPRFRVFSGSMLFNPIVATQRLLQIARETGNPMDAVRWFRGVPDLIAHGSGRGVAIKAVCGVECDDVVPLSREVSLYPMRMVPQSRLKEDLLRRYERTFVDGPIAQGIVMPPRSALVRNGEFVALSASEDHIPANEPSTAYFEILDSASQMLALISNAIPLEAARWYHFDDQHVAVLCQTGLSRLGTDIPDPPFAQLAKITAGSVDGLLDSYLAMSADYQKVLTLAISRLIRSRCHMLPGNKAIDLAIALEVLFMGAERDEHS